MTPVRFSQPASDELTAAIRWYEERRTGLRAELYEAVVRTIDLIRNHPDSGSPRRGRVPSRQLRVARFPYKVVYRVRRDDIYAQFPFSIGKAVVNGPQRRGGGARSNRARCRGW